MSTLFYVVDLDERGTFNAHVEDIDGNIIYSIANNEETGELWIIEDGFMKHTTDIKGLEIYLKELEVIGDDDEIVMQK